MAREDSGTVAAEHGGGTILRRAQGITKEVSDGTKEGEKGVAAERVGKGRAVDSGLTLGKGKQDRPSGRVRQSGAGEASDGEEGGEVAARARRASRTTSGGPRMWISSAYATTTPRLPSRR